MVKLTSTQEARAKSLMIDLCISAGVIPNERSMSYCDLSRYMLINSEGYYASQYKDSANSIISIITRRTFTFDQLDKAISSLCYYNAEVGVTPAKNETQIYYLHRVGAETVAKYIAFSCASSKLYWDDSVYSRTEIEDFAKKYTSAKWLYEFNCFASQADLAPKASSTRAASTGVPGAPKIGYKAAGPQSKNVVGLVGTPGEKITKSGDMYCVTGDKIGTRVPSAFIKPVENTDLGLHAALTADGVPALRFGAGNGYTELTIYSDNKATMEKALELLTKKGYTSKYSGLHVAQIKAASEGYFAVNTEVGEVYVKPTKLNEELFTEVFEAMKTPIAEDNLDLIEDFPSAKIEDIEQFTRDSKMYD